MNRGLETRMRLVIALAAIGLNVVFAWAAFDRALPQIEAFKAQAAASWHEHPNGPMPVPDTLVQVLSPEVPVATSWWLIATAVAALAVVVLYRRPDRLLTFSYFETVTILTLSALAVASSSVANALSGLGSLV